MSFRYRSRERDRDDRKDRGGFGMPREREREWDARDDWNREGTWERNNNSNNSSNCSNTSRGDRGDRERERYSERECSRERDRDYDRSSRDREKGGDHHHHHRDHHRDRSRDTNSKEKDRSYDDRESYNNNRDRERYRERDKGSNNRYKRNHDYNNIDEDNNLSYQNNAKDGGYGSDRNTIQKWDWSCYKCGVNNFKRREQCFKCGTPREESAAAIEVGDEISLNPTNCLILRDLATHTTEEKILTALEQVTALPIKSIRIPRDPINGSTRCICFVELHTTLEASQLFNLLCSSNPGLIVDGYPLKVCYAKRNVSSSITPRVSNVASVALAAAQWTNQSEQPSTANIASTNSTITTTGDSTYSDPTTSNSSKSFGSNHHAKSNEQTTLGLGTVSVNGILYPKYPSPDTSTYQYDENSGYYYDVSTGLYYDANSHYYYNPTTQSYLFWDGNHSTYLPVDNKNTSSSSSSTSHGQFNDQNLTKSAESNCKNRDDKTTSNDCHDKSKETQEFGKQDKVMIAKKIAKDMEKWAKTLNQKKEGSKFLSQSTAVAFSSEENEIPVPTPTSTPASSSSHSQPTIYSSKTKLYGSHETEPIKKRRFDYEQTVDSPEHKTEILEKPDSDDSSSQSPNQPDSSIQAQEQKLIDWERLLCFLCKRQFNSKEQLLKHQQASDLHKSNLIKLAESKFYENQHGESGSSSGDYGYRDRARERRLKYGQPEVPEGETNISVRPPSPVKYDTPKPVSGIGSKMLKAMGWSEGEGLGKSKTGTSSIIEVERRATGVGIGMKATTASAGESYKDAVKRASWLRFQELSKNE